MTDETSADLNQTFTGSSLVPVGAIVMFIDATSYLWSISECRVFVVVIFSVCRWFDHVKWTKRHFLLPLFCVVTFFRVFGWEGNVRNQPAGQPLLGQAFFTCVFSQHLSHQHATQHIVITLRAWSVARMFVWEHWDHLRICLKWKCKNCSCAKLMLAYWCHFKESRRRWETFNSWELIYIWQKSIWIFLKL